MTAKRVTDRQQGVRQRRQPAPAAGRVHPRALNGEVTRELLVDTAERLFATEGVEGVSIRSVNAAAGLAPASIHYHFGSKEGLVQAVLTRRGNRLMRRLGELLDELERREDLTGRDLVEAFATPFVELLRDDPAGGQQWIRFIALLAQTQNRVLQALTTAPTQPDARFQALLVRIYPNAPEGEVRLRWRIGANALLRLLADSEGPMARGVQSGEFVSGLIDFVVSGVEGLGVTGDTRRRARRRAVR